MTRIIPIKELRNTTEISELVKEENEPIYVTKNGYGDMVIMSIETYDNLIGTREIDYAIMKSEAEINEGAELLDAKSALKDLEEKHFG